MRTRSISSPLSPCPGIRACVFARGDSPAGKSASPEIALRRERRMRWKFDEPSRTSGSDRSGSGVKTIPLRRQGLSLCP